MRPRAGVPTAFTLVELLMVLVVIATFASAIAVSLHGRADRHALETSAKDLSSAIRSAAAAARALGSSVRVMLSPDRSSFRVETWSVSQSAFIPASGVAGTWRRFPAEVRVAEVVLAGDAEANSTASVIEFAQASSFAGKIRLAGRNGEHCDISVLPVTAEVLRAP